MTIVHVCYEGMFVYSHLSGVHIWCLVHLETTVDVANKCQWGPERHAAQHQREDHRCEQRVTKELGALHQAAHRGPVPVVENRVDEDEEASGAGAQDAPPPPPVVFARQQEVGESNRDAGSHWEEDGEDAKQDAIEGVVLSAPNRGKYVVQLHWDGTGGEKKWKSIGCNIFFYYILRIVILKKRTRQSRWQRLNFNWKHLQSRLYTLSKLFWTYK